MFKMLLILVCLQILAGQASAWNDGELLIWIEADKGYRGLAEVGRRFERELGVPVKVETPNDLTEKFESAARSGKGPDIVFWAHDRLGEWADSGLLKSLEIRDEFKSEFIPMSWEAVTYDGKTWGYPIALEAVSLIFNKKFVSKPPTQLSELSAFEKDLKAKDPGVIPILWDYGTAYFTWPFLASAGGYPFKKLASGYDTSDIGVNTPGAVKGLQEVVDLISSGLLPKGASYSVMEQKMNENSLALMISGPWSWANLRRSGIDFDLAPLPGIAGHPGKPFVGVLTALINRSTPNAEQAIQFLEKFVCTKEGLRTIDEDVPIGLPALKSLSDELSATNPLIKITYQNVENGEVMPNIPKMSLFWSALTTAVRVATSGQASPQAALDDAEKRMEK